MIREYLRSQRQLAPPHHERVFSEEEAALCRSTSALVTHTLPWGPLLCGAPRHQHRRSGAASACRGRWRARDSARCASRVSGCTQRPLGSSANAHCRCPRTPRRSATAYAGHGSQIQAQRPLLEFSVAYSASISHPGRSSKMAVASEPLLYRGTGSRAHAHLQVAHVWGVRACLQQQLAPPLAEQKRELRQLTPPRLRRLIGQRQLSLPQ